MGALPKILVLGTWNPEISQKFLIEGQELGKALAEGYSLVASPSEGMQGIVAKSYKENGGQNFIGFYPDTALMRQIGEKVKVEPDTAIHLHVDYPGRNNYQINNADAIIIVTGGRGTLTESINAIFDYNKPVAYLKGSSQLMDDFIKIDPGFKEKIYVGNTIDEIIKQTQKNLNLK